mmetsp:Transcript_21854/g.49816  ORF Transcript_21854/g.49816 Transcript_21854/m.49816 type:complete len:936 (+) Transcript_21854:59-2866(+)
MQLAVVLFGAAAAAQPLALMSQQVNRSNSWSEVSEAHAAVRRALVGWSWQHERPHFDAAMDRVPLETMLKHVGDQIPQRVLAALRKHKGDGPESLSEDELNHARGVINGMMEGQVTQLDISVVECKELKDKNTMTENVVVADLSRLGTKLANEKKRIIESQAGIEDAQKNIKDSEDALRTHQAQCQTTVSTLESQLAIIKMDLDAASLIVKLTECKPPAATLLQANRSTSSTVPVKACAQKSNMVVSAKSKDVKLQQASAAAFERALRASVASGVELLQMGQDPKHPEVPNYNRSATAGVCASTDKEGKVTPGCEAFKDSSLVEGTTTAQECADACTKNPLCKMFQFASGPSGGMCRVMFAECKEECLLTTPETEMFTVYNKGEPPMAVGEEQMPEVAPARDTPPAAAQAFKCTMADPDCGLLNDNMAIFWGEVKDRYDEKLTELVAAKKQCSDMSTTINEEITLWNALLQERNTELGDATGEQSEATQTQIDKQREQRELQGEFKEIDTKCTHLVGEIMMNLCGLRKVRGELGKFSKGSMTPDLIVDCVVTDWTPQECSKSCEGGRQILQRTVSQEMSLGIKCPPLQMVKKCNEFPCPINCAMGQWSKWGRCSKECGGGLQARVRNIETRPDFGGEACPPQSETQQCNPDSCDADCELSEWSKWKPCSKACGKGSQKRVKHVTSPARGAGRCANELNVVRYERQECNVNDCPPDPVCKAKLDIVLVIDSSGSWTQKGYDVVRKFVEGFVDRYDIGDKKVKMGIVEFSKEAHIIQGMTHSKADLEDAIAGKLQFRRGLTDMAKGLLTAEKVLLEGRKDAQSEVIVITDGKPSFKFGTHNAAKKLTRGGVRLVFMPVRTYGNSPFLKDWATHPGSENVFRVKAGLAELEEKMADWQKKLLVSTCPVIFSPLLEKAKQDQIDAEAARAADLTTAAPQ